MTAIAVVAGYANREKLRLKISSVYASVPPKAAQTPPPASRPDVAFTGEAPWAFSALPECFQPWDKTTGADLHFVLAHLPKKAAMVRPPAKLRYADCTVLVRGDAITVERGEDRLGVPPPARLYTAPGRVAVLRAAGGGYELRTYKVRL